MRLSFFSILLLLCFLTNYGQYKVPELLNISEASKYEEDSLITTLKSNSKVLIAFRTYSVWSFYSRYCLLTLGNDDSLRYHILITEPKMRGLYRLKIPLKTLDSIWNNCFKNKLFSIKTESKTHNNCNSIIFDSGHYEFVIIVGEKKKIIEYYAPEFFEKECPGDKYRKLLINCAKPFLNNNKL